LIEVGVVGTLNLDLILYLLPEQLSPDRELLASNMAFTPGSLSEIFADNLGVLGGRKLALCRRLKTIPLERWRWSGFPRWGLIPRV
jgi:hypothetical protein